MRVLLGLAAIAAIVPPAPAQAQSSSSSSFAEPSNGGWTATWSHHHHSGDGRFHGHVHQGLPPGYANSAYGYAAYTDYSDFDGNRGFDPDKWNDWWHDRPDRAFPRWMSRNQDCARRWYSGDVLTC
jgi:hypothetical protein